MRLRLVYLLSPRLRLMSLLNGMAMIRWGIVTRGQVSGGALSRMVKLTGGRGREVAGAETGGAVTQVRRGMLTRKVAKARRRIAVVGLGRNGMSGVFGLLAGWDE